jgi:TolB-like protein
VSGGWLARLKQRKVFRMTGFYAVTGYAVFQIANNLLPALNLPRWTVTLLAALYVVGFPLVIGLSYAFDYADGRLHRTLPGRQRAPALGWFDWSLLGAALLMLVVAGVQLVRGVSAPGGLGTPTETAAVAPARSIAVLPFVSFSEGKDGEYFADGLTEELINGLAQMPDLHVAGRTSAFYFKGRNEDLREIGRKLGVAHVLEGSVRRSGGTLRITAQLIKVSDGFHLWSQTFDQLVDDALAVQTHIATAVAQALKVHLVDGGGAGARRDPRAWQLELTARSRLRKQEVAELQAARGMFSELMRLEPDNARAYTGFAEASILLAQNHLALDFDTARTESERAVATALRLAPTSAEAWRVNGLINRVLAIRSGEQPFAATALRAFQRAVELDSRDSDALTLYAAQRLTAGQAEEAVNLLRRALGIDPLSRLAQQLLGSALENQGKIAEATRQYAGLIELHPDFTSARGALGSLLLETGRLDEAVHALDDAAAIRADPLLGLMLALAYANLGMPAEATTVLQSIREPASAAVIGRSALLLQAGKLREFRDYAARQLADTRDPLWRSSLLLAAVLLNDTAEERRLAADPAHGLRQNPPVIDQSTTIDALIFAEALRRGGEGEQAERIGRALLSHYASAPPEFDPPKARTARVLAAASLGDLPRALDELEAAEKAGFRMLIDFDYFQRIESYPFVTQLAREPRYAAAVRRIEEDNRRMREHLLASHGGRT